MGSSASKAASSVARTAATSTTRKYPSRSPVPPPSTRTNARPQRTGPIWQPSTSRGTVVAETRERGVQLDSSELDLDMGLAKRLSELGPVQANPTHSNSSAFNQSFSPTQISSSSAFQHSLSTSGQTVFPTSKPNAAVSLLTARYRLAEEAEEEFANIGKKSSQGRQFLDVITIRQILVLRDKGVPEEEIERGLGLRRGLVARLGRAGLVRISEG